MSDGPANIKATITMSQVPESDWIKLVCDKDGWSQRCWPENVDHHVMEHAQEHGATEFIMTPAVYPNPRETKIVLF